MTSFLIAVNAVVPFICYMAYGYLFRHLGYGDEAFYKKFNKIVFKAFFSLLMFNSIYTADIDLKSNARLVGYMVVLLIVIILLVSLLVPLFIKDRRRIPVINQSIWRSNTLMFAYPLAISLYGEDAGATASIVIAVLVSVYNVASVCLFAFYANEGGDKPNVRKIIYDILTNPLIVGAIVGGLFKLLRISLPSALEKPVAQFATMTTPLAIFILGATLELPEIKKNLHLIFSTLILKLVLVPALVLAVSYAFGFRKLDLFLGFIIFATPVASASFVMAENMGGDSELQGQILAFSTVFSIVTVFFWIMAGTAAGLF